MFTHGIVRIKSEILLGASNEDDHLKGNITDWDFFWKNTKTLADI